MALQKFLREKENFGESVKYTDALMKIIKYIRLLLRSRIIHKLSEQYILNYKNLQEVIIGTYNQILNGKFREKYAPLLNFVSDWIRYDYIVNRPTNSLFSAITGYLQNLSEDAVYEIWIFYKILQLLEPIKQSKRHHHKLFTNNQDHISIQYQSQENISWKLNKAGTQLF